MINKILFYAIAGTFLLLHACKGPGERREGAGVRLHDTTRLTRVELPERIFDFGNIASGEIVGHTFRVNNAGDKNLVIHDILTGCGCTTVDYTRRAVRPGKSAVIEIKFDTAGRHGKQYKVIQVHANVREKMFELAFKANILN
jgi:hypothetical protein